MSTEPIEEPTDGTIPDGTQIPSDDDLPDEEGDAGVNDTGTEEWYGEDLPPEVPD